MSAFGGLLLTNQGRNLQQKAQIGVELKFTRIALGDGSLSGSAIIDLKALKHEVISLGLKKLKLMPDGKAVVGAVLSNVGLTNGFYWRELGVFAHDPNIGEILYCYGNAGVDAEYIPADGGPDLVEKTIDVITIVENAPNVSAVINQSLVFETIEGSEQKLQEAKNYTNTKVKEVQDSLDILEGNFATHVADNTAHELGDKTKLLTKEKTTVVNAVNSHVEDYVQHPAYAVTSGTNAYTVTLDPAPASLVSGMGIVLKITNNASGICTLNVNNLGAKPIVGSEGTPITNLKANAIYTLRFNGVNFILQGEGGNAKVTNGLLKTGINGEITRFSDEKYLYTVKTLSYANYRACKYDKSTGSLVKVINFTSTSTGGNTHLTYTADGIFHRDSYSFPELRVYDENKTLLRVINFELNENLRQVQYGKDLNELAFTTIYAVTLYDTNGTLIKILYKERDQYSSVQDLTIYRGSTKMEAYVITTRSSANYYGFFDTKGLTVSDDYYAESTQVSSNAMIINHFNQYLSSI